MGAIAVIAMTHPPVNAFGAQLRTELFAAISAADEAPDIDAIVLHGSGRGFSAGGDITEFNTPAAAAWPGLSSDLHPRMEACRKPVIAAVHGLCMGGGLETAMVCHARVVAFDAALALPEVRVGALALSGTQRLPRLIGLEPAATWIASGDRLPLACVRALADRVVDDSGEAAVVSAAMDLARGRSIAMPLGPLVRHRPVLGLDRLNAVREMAEMAPDGGVRCALLAVLAAAEEADFEGGLARARSLYEGWIRSPDAMALQRAFIDRKTSRT